MNRRRLRHAVVAVVLSLGVATTAGALGSGAIGAATVGEPAVRGDTARVGVPQHPDTTPHVVPVAEAGRAGWSATHSSYPATDIFLGCGAQLVSPVWGTVNEVRRIDGWDPAVDNPATRGGRSVAIIGFDGVRYYLAHFETIVGDLAVGDEVAAGDVIGTMGDSGRTSACHLHFAISPPCPGKEWSVRRGVVWPFPYLDDWRAGGQLSPVDEVLAWSAANPDACAEAMADPFAPDA